ncbi:MAG: tRNA pseudouridine(55) synthase TruB [Erysipelotrichaceae bacterium]|nr:tRNA pseudouridine(55) synthase TruB [Erysipelotrichaceae bacterium]
MRNVLFVDKPSGMTSFDVCFKLRKVLNTRKIGHTGTLDPLATGVMIVLFDKATKANQFLVSDRKTYRTRVLLGKQTDTLDIEGNILSEEEYDVPGKDVLESTLDSFLGKSKQTVPMTSAVKVDGKRLYQYQKQNIDVELPVRNIEVYSISLTDMHEDGFSFECNVSSGTYIRALARDILDKLGIKGCVMELRRTMVDDITIDMCDRLDDILEGRYQTHDIGELLSKRYPAYEYEDMDDIMNGRKIKIDSDDEKVLIVHDGEALAIYEKNGSAYRCLRGLW